MISLKVPNSPQIKIQKILLLILVLILGLGGVYAYTNLSQFKLNVDKSNYVETIPYQYQIENISDISELEKRVRKVDWSSIKAKSVYAFNPKTGKVYFSRNINQQLPIASITKLVTVLTSKEIYQDSDTLKISTPLPKMDNPLGLKVGDTITAQNLYVCALVSSKNDCANTIAYTYGYDNFIQEMNELTTKLELKNSKFSNPTGYINEGNYSSAYDLGILTSVFVRDASLVSITDLSSANIKYSGGNKRVFSTNLMLGENKNIKGLKTGFTYASGECLVLYYDYGNNEKLITIVLNSPDRFGESRKIFDNVIKEFNP
jgi:D-alanyl-D-alanine carboxypeptidase (penicillin-binding protein 5/6)